MDYLSITFSRAHDLIDRGHSAPVQLAPSHSPCSPPYATMPPLLSRFERPSLALLLLAALAGALSSLKQSLRHLGSDLVVEIGG
jgi:hypothetical protein